VARELWDLGFLVQLFFWVMPRILRKLYVLGCIVHMDSGSFVPLKNRHHSIKGVELPSNKVKFVFLVILSQWLL
jgi:hypothetical protein